MDIAGKPNTSPTACTLVQCEKCLKWRKISSAQAKEIGVETQWFCSLNSDKAYASCDVPELKFTLPRGMKYIYSLLPLGELVIARLTGHPFWPAVLSPDPVSGDYYDCLLVKPDEPTYYHVEFLGRPRSHAWLRVSAVETFNHRKLKDQLSQLPSAKQARLTHALAEAKYFGKLSPAQRTDACTFQYTESLCADKENVSLDTRQHRHSMHVSEDAMAEQGSRLGVLDETNCILRKRGRKRKRDSNWSSEWSLEEAATKTLKTSTKTEPQITNQNEKSIQVISEDESKFLCSYQKHLSILGSPAPKPPRWRGKTVNVFNLYRLVISQGGYHQVCKDRQWSRIYQALTSEHGQELVSESRMSSCLKGFYAKSLLSYELMVSSIRGELGGRSSDPGQMRAEEAGALAALDDVVTSSNPNSPDVQVDSQGDSNLHSLEAECQETMKDILQIERTLSSAEDSSETQDMSSPVEARILKIEMSPQSTNQSNLTLNHDQDIMDALQEIGKIEDAIADLERSLGLNF